ncbi:MAG TPA: type IV pilus secretin PilQ [Nitrospiraceae bacterium]|jgi:type IV pilus assembly protein PilQ|nr:type IV pilus secretin PilQ [Nitrospiraceae bacterium]
MSRIRRHSRIVLSWVAFWAIGGPALAFGGADTVPDAAGARGGFSIVDANVGGPEVAEAMDDAGSAGYGVGMPVRVRAQAGVVDRIDVKRSAEEVTVLVSGDGRFRYREQLIDGTRLILDLADVASAVPFPVLTIDHPLLKRIRIGNHPDKIRLVFDLSGPVRHDVHLEDGRIVVRLMNRPEPAEPAVSTPRFMMDGKSSAQVVGTSSGTFKPALWVERAPRRAVAPRLAQMATEPNDKEGKESRESDMVTGQTRFVGRRISLDFQQADITNVLRLIAEVSGFNIVVGEGVKAKVTMKLVSVPWDQALDMLLRMNGLGMIKQGNIVWVDTLANIAKQQDDEARVKESKTKAEPLVTRVFYIRNVNAQELMTSLRQYLSPRGTMNFNVASNALVVKDTESQMVAFKQLVEGLDLELPQVQIEARIVQADTTYTRSLGVQWGIQNVNQMGPSFGVANFRSGNTGAFGAQASDFLVNLPAAVTGLAATPAAGFTFGKADGALLDLRLSAGELLGLTKVIAAPKITTLDKRDAKIAQGESIPFQTTSLQGTQTTFVDANLELNVTPQITSRDPKEIGKQILLKVRATRNAVGARSNPAGPSIDRREATTQVMVRDGETMVIGGVFVDTQTNTVTGVPYLSRIPVLGWLFKSKTESVAKQELLIFLTPTIVKSS